MERTVAVTGGAGYLGSHLVRALLERGHRVRVLDALLFGNGLEDLGEHPRLELVEGDVRDLVDLIRVCRGTDAVFHLAAIVGDAACRVDPEVTWSVNVESTKLVLDVCERYQVPRLVLASTCSVYGASDHLLLNEGSLRRPVSLYAETRIAAEELCFAARASGIAVTCLRLATLYGLAARMRFDLVVNVMAARAIGEGRIPIYGGAQWRPLVHTADAADAFVAVLDAPTELVAGQVFNVGSDDQNFQIADLGRRIAAALGARVEQRAPTPDDLRNYRVSFEKIAHHLGFKPRRTIEDACEEIAAFLRADPAVDAGADRFHNHRYPYSVDPRFPSPYRTTLRASDEDAGVSGPRRGSERPS